MRTRCVLASIAFWAMTAATAGYGETADTPLSRSVSVRYDPRVELFRIVVYLAQDPESQEQYLRSYSQQVDEHFGPFAGHPAVAYTRWLIGERKLDFSRIGGLALYLTDPPALEPRIPLPENETLSIGEASLDEVARGVEFIRQFAVDADFQGFRESQAAYYAETEKRLRKLIEEHTDLAWFDQFFGTRPATSFHITANPLSGGGSFGPSVVLPGNAEYHCVLGVWKMDGQGLPVFDETVVPIVVHEFCHSYGNPLLAAHMSEFESAANTLYPQVADRLKPMGYGHWHALLYESLVRVCVVRYLFAQGETGLATAQADEEKGAFPWMGELSRLFEQYESDRAQYPTIEAFVPVLVGFFNTYAERTQTETPGWRPWLTTSKNGAE